MVIRVATRFGFAVVVVRSLLGVLASVLWWALDSGPLTSEPRLVLTETAGSSAVRVYGDTPGTDDDDIAARRTVDDLVEAGGFTRSVLLVTIPTGSGWVDPAQVTAIEAWAGGDVATVAMRYSAAPSAVVFALRPEVAAESARAVLGEVTSRLRAIPADDQPMLVVHGLSLGAQAGREALRDPEIAGVVDVALWQGLPGSATDPPQRDCTVVEVNHDDPVAELEWSLLRDPVRTLVVLAALPGSDSMDPGTGHRYRPVLPPADCIAPGY